MLLAGFGRRYRGYLRQGAISVKESLPSPVTLTGPFELAPCTLTNQPKQNSGLCCALAPRRREGVEFTDHTGSSESLAVIRVGDRDLQEISP